MRQFFNGEMGSAAHTSVWEPQRRGALRVRCESCGTMGAYDAANPVCNCGQPLPPQPVYW